MFNNRVFLAALGIILLEMSEVSAVAINPEKIEIVNPILSDILPSLSQGASCFSDRLNLPVGKLNSDLHRRNFGSAPPYFLQPTVVDVDCGIQIAIDLVSAIFAIESAI